MLPIFLVGILVSITSYLTNEKVVPWTNHASQNILRRLFLSHPLPHIQENVIFKGGPNHHFFIKRYYPATATAEGISIYEIGGREKFPRAITAKSAKWKKKSWLLKDGIIHDFDKKGFLKYEMSFESLEINVDFNVIDFFGTQRTPQEMSRKELLKQIKIFERGGIDTKRLKTDYHFKISIPFACLIVVLIGAPLSLKASAGGTFIGILLCILLISVYNILMSIGRAMGFSGLLPPFLAAWLPNILFIVVGGFLSWKVEH
jgi:lipopolysaccharide export system permease protein